MFEENDFVFNTESVYFIFILQDSPNMTDMNKTNTLQNLHTIQFPQAFLTNPSKLGTYRYKIPTVITETLIK
jgi:hypothetical protein